MEKWLSDEWFDLTRAMVADQPGCPGLSGRIQYQVTGGRDGDVWYYWILDDGHIRAGGSGVLEDPDVTVTTAWADAAAIHRGDLDPSVAFMQGRMKVAGSMRTVMALLPKTSTGGRIELRRRIAEITEMGRGAIPPTSDRVDPG